MSAPPGRDFTYDALAGRVVFGIGARHRLADEVDHLDAHRILIVAGDFESSVADEVSATLGDRLIGRYTDVVQHVPVDKAAAAIAMARDTEADTIVTIGGGSATGFGKAIALDVDVVQVALPTTYAGSEMTPIWGKTDGGHKVTGRDPRVKPETVIYDPELTFRLPMRIAGPSGMNALAHSVEALYGPGANPVIEAIALESVRALSGSLPRLNDFGTDKAERVDVFYGAYLAGVALATGGTALHHKTCHVLGGMFDLNHGDMNAVVLGHAVAYNAPAIPAVIEKMADRLDVEPADVPGALFDIAVAIGAPTSLAAIGMPRSGLDEAVERVVIEAKANVRPPEPQAVRRMLEDAFEGRRPATPRS